MNKIHFHSLYSAYALGMEVYSSCTLFFFDFFFQAGDVPNLDNLIEENAVFLRISCNIAYFCIFTFNKAKLDIIIATADPNSDWEGLALVNSDLRNGAKKLKVCNSVREFGIWFYSTGTVKCF